MSEEVESTEIVKEAAAVEEKAEVKVEEVKAPEAEAPKQAQAKPERKPQGGGQQQQQQQPRREQQQRPGGNRQENRGGGENRGPRPEHRGGGRPGGDRGGRPFDGPVDIELEKLISDSLYLDNQAHVVVMRMRDMDSGTKSQLRRLYNAVRRAVRAPESERQHHFVMLRARLAYTIARHSLRSLDALERLLLQVTRKNDPRGYERFKDLFEAIVAYNE